MQISIATITSKPAYAFIACTLALVSYASVANESAGASNEEGIANYASYRNKSYALEAAAKIETQLASSVEINEVEINGSIWLRLHSGPIDAIEAKSLVVRATAAGFPAWYQIAPTASPVTAAGAPVLPLQQISTTQTRGWSQCCLKDHCSATFTRRARPYRKTPSANARAKLGSTLQLTEDALRGQLRHLVFAESNFCQYGDRVFTEFWSRTNFCQRCTFKTH